MSTSSTPALPPPPDPKELAPVTSVEPTTAETIGGGIRHIFSNAAGEDFSKTAIGQAIQRHQQQRLATAQMGQKNANIMAAALGAGEIGADGKPTGMIPDPKTGEERPMTAQERELYLGQWQNAHEQYAKAAGVDKDTKAHIQKQQQLHQFLIEKGHKAFRAMAGALGLDKQQQGGGQPDGPMAPPPSPSPSPAQGATAMTPTQMEQGTADARTLSMKQHETDMGMRAKIAEEQAMPWKRTTGTYTTPDGKQFTGAVEPTTGKIENVDTGEVVEGAIKETAGMQAAPQVKTVNGVPFSVTRDGKDITPDSPDFTPADKRLLDNAKEAYRQGNLDKAKARQTQMNAYVNAREKAYQYSVIDKTTGEPTMASSYDINKNPGKYMAGALGQQLKNRAGIFDEINYTKDQFNDALGKLTEDDFNALPRAQIAMALKSRDPRSAMSEFMGSQVGTTLSPAQVDYVTGLLSMTESAMALRSIAGMGQGSDTLRAAITGMLPGPSTPSKSYAERQMRLFKGELDALHKPVPDSSKLGMGGSKDVPPPPSPDGKKTIHYKIVNGELVPQ